MAGVYRSTISVLMCASLAGYAVAQQGTPAAAPVPGALIAASLKGDPKPQVGRLEKAAGLQATPEGITLDGKAGRLQYTVENFPRENYSVRVRVRLDRAPSGGLAQVFSSWVGPWDDPLRLFVSQGRVMAAVEMGGKAYVTPSAPLEPGGWHELVAVKQGAELTLYVDGQRIGSTPVPASVTSRSRSVALGANPSEANGEYLPATFADFTLYGHALAEVEVLKPITREYTLVWKPFDPTKGTHTADGAVYLPVPTTNLPYQTSTTTISGAASYRIVRINGNDIAFVMPNGNRPFTMRSTVLTRTFTYKPQLDAIAGQRAAKPYPPEVLPFVGPAYPSLNPQSPVLRRVVAPLRTSDPLTTVRNILAWQRKNIRSAKAVPVANGEDVLRLGFADCTMHSLLLDSLCRAAGIPARHVRGEVHEPGPIAASGTFGGHSWDEVYFTGIGWVPVEPQKPESLGDPGGAGFLSCYIRMEHIEPHLSIGCGNDEDRKRLTPTSNMGLMGGEDATYRMRVLPDGPPG